MSETQFVCLDEGVKTDPNKTAFLPSAVVQTANIHHTLIGQSLTGTETSKSMFYSFILFSFT